MPNINNIILARTPLTQSNAWTLDTFLGLQTSSRVMAMIFDILLLSSCLYVHVIFQESLSIELYLMRISLNRMANLHVQCHGFEFSCKMLAFGLSSKALSNAYTGICNAHKLGSTYFKVINGKSFARHHLPSSSCYSSSLAVESALANSHPPKRQYFQQGCCPNVHRLHGDNVCYCVKVIYLISKES